MIMTESSVIQPSTVRWPRNRTSRAIEDLQRSTQDEADYIPHQPEDLASYCNWITPIATDTVITGLHEFSDDQLSQLTTMSSRSENDPPNRSRSGIRDRLKAIYRRFFPEEKERCASCYEDFRPTRLILTPCKHQYCHRCLRKVAILSLQNKSIFPARCCGQAIPTQQVLSTMSARRKRLYASRVDEEAVPPAERWYCPQANCRRWIHTKHLRPDSKYQTCPRCRTKICPQCRDIAHMTTGCTRDPGLPGILEMARRRHWQRCYECHAMVEKNGGCHHVRCICGADFCYLCGRPFPGCRCRQGDEVNADDPVVFADEEENLALFLVAMDQAERESALEAERRTTVEAMSMAMAMSR